MFVVILSRIDGETKNFVNLDQSDLVQISSTDGIRPIAEYCPCIETARFDHCFI